jgi:hypothetical protein
LLNLLEPPLGEPFALASAFPFFPAAGAGADFFVALMQLSDCAAAQPVDRKPQPFVGKQLSPIHQEPLIASVPTGGENSSQTDIFHHRPWPSPPVPTRVFGPLASTRPSRQLPHRMLSELVTQLTPERGLAMSLRTNKYTQILAVFALFSTKMMENSNS